MNRLEVNKIQCTFDEKIINVLADNLRNKRVSWLHEVASKKSVKHQSILIEIRIKLLDP